jgi:hypothetical protein
MEKQKICLVAGCSHSSGSEIDGTEDSAYNRSMSFGNQLGSLIGAEKIINIAVGGSANTGISRAVMRWFKDNYDPNLMKVFVCVGWTENVRLEVPALAQPMDYYRSNTTSDWFDYSVHSFYRVNLGWEGLQPEEKEVHKYFHKFIVEQTRFIEIMTIKNVLELQYFLKMHDIDYVMCNTMHMFTLPDSHLDIYSEFLDKNRYFSWNNNEESFFWKYRNAGYINPKAKYWHHNEEPHRLQAERLYKFIGEKSCF